LRNAAEIREEVKAWSSNPDGTARYFLRRPKSVLEITLPTKHIGCQSLDVVPSELVMYSKLEDTLLKCFRALAHHMDHPQHGDPSWVAEKKALTRRMIAVMQLIRMSLLHSIVPGGREVTKLFSPSRCRRSEKPKKSCVVCEYSEEHDDDPPPDSDQMDAGLDGGADLDGGLTRAESREAQGLDSGQEEEQEEEDDDWGEQAEEAGAWQQKKKARKPSRKAKATREDGAEGRLQLLPEEMCDAPRRFCSSSRHWVHERCLPALSTPPPVAVSAEEEDSVETFEAKHESQRAAGEADGEDAVKHEGHDLKCPKCRSFMQLLQSGIESVPPIQSARESGKPRLSLSPSTKLQHVKEWLDAIPPGEKAIVFSYFKGFLDLVEGIITQASPAGTRELCARFDGDDNQAARERTLQQFKERSSCRFLLATITTGGVGLNLVEANHVIFADRWFNPTVHEQAIDRTHRIKQTKEVHVEYVDARDTFDEVVKEILARKFHNATIMLGDGLEIGAGAGESLSYSELAGEMGMLLKQVQARRLGLPDPGARPDPDVNADPYARAEPGVKAEPAYAYAHADPEGGDGPPPQPLALPPPPAPAPPPLPPPVLPQLGNFSDHVADVGQAFTAAFTAVLNAGLQRHGIPVPGVAGVCHVCRRPATIGTWPLQQWCGLCHPGSAV